MGIAPSREQFCKLAKTGNLIPVVREILADTETPVSAYAKIADGEHAFLLESVSGGENVARYSFVGANPAVVIRARDGKVAVHENGAVEEAEGDPLSVLKSVMARYTPVPAPEELKLPRFHGGAVGFLGYDTVRFFDRVPVTNPDVLDVDEAVFLIADTILCFDHARQRIQVIANAHVADDPNKAYDEAVRAVENLANKLMRPMVVASPAPVEGDVPDVKSNQTREEFEANVERCKEYIAAGDAFQIVYSQKFMRPLRVEPFHVYRALRAVNPSPYMFLLRLGDMHLVGSSPEVHVRLEHGKVTLRPIAGTRPRAATEEEDRRVEQELLADVKERAEHIMLVDLGRNDVGRVCEFDSVSVDELMVIERYSHVMHIVSNVIGTIKPGYDAYDLIRATLPAGTVSGAPKIRAMEIIDELEPDRRGPYAGCVGYFDYSGNLDSCITIRTALCKKGMAYVQAGGGIVYDSVPVKEYEESVNKSRGVLRAIELARGGIGILADGRQKMILVLDNYDSFTYNLVQYLGELGAELEVVRNDVTTPAEIAAKNPERIVISPGPCTPNEAGISMDLIRELGPTIPILGVCLGHQAIGQVYGAQVVRAGLPMHGKISEFTHDGRGVFAGIASPMTATRYHSLVIEPSSVPDCLEVSARTDDGIIMGVRHKEHPVEGVQFHPESILTTDGKKLLKNFLDGRIGGRSE